MDAFIPLTVALIVLLGINFRALKAFDDLVEGLHDVHKDLWVAQGRPIGTFWRPEDPEVKLVSSLLARQRFRSGLMSQAPDWLPEDSPLHVKVATYRITTLAGWGGLALLGVALGVFGAING